MISDSACARALLAGAAGCVLAGMASAELVEYRFSGVQSGSLGGVPFSNAMCVISHYADTSGIMQMFPHTFPNVFGVDGATVISIEGLGTAQFFHAMRVFSNQHWNPSSVGFNDATLNLDVFSLESAAFNGYVLEGNFGPVTVSDPWSSSKPASTPTSAGALIIQDPPQAITFEAVVIPSPATGLVVAIGLAALRRRGR